MISKPWWNPFILTILCSTEARCNFKKSPQDALQPYLRLQNLVNALKDAQPAAEDAAPHLVDHVDRTVRTLWHQMKDAFASDFESTLKSMQWPGKDVTLNEQLEREWTDGAKKLLELQEPELKARDSQTVDTTKGEEPLVLLPLEVMAKPLELRFKYHFEGDRPTNKLDKVRLNLGTRRDGADTSSLSTFSRTSLVC